MGIALRIVRHVVIYNVTDAFNIQAASGNVGGDQDIDLAVFQLLNGAFALLLVDVAVNRRSGKPACLQFARQFFRAHFGTRKNDHAVESFSFQNARQGIQLVHATDQPVTLTNIIGRAGFGGDGDFCRIMQIRFGDAFDHGWHGGREQRCLAGCRGFFQNPFDIVDETHAQHFVGFIQHQCL